MAYSKGVEDFFDKKNPKIFRFVTLPLEIREKTKLPSWKFPKIVLQCLKIPSRKTKLQIPYDFCKQIPSEISCPQPFCLDFFWNSPM